MRVLTLTLLILSKHNFYLMDGRTYSRKQRTEWGRKDLTQNWGREVRLGAVRRLDAGGPDSRAIRRKLRGRHISCREGWAVTKWWLMTPTVHCGWKAMKWEPFCAEFMHTHTHTYSKQSILFAKYWPCWLSSNTFAKLWLSFLYQ